MASRPEITPNQVTVTGPETLVSVLSHINTEPLRLARRRSSFRQQVRLESSDPDLHLHPIEVEVALGIDEIVEKAFVNVPISILSDIESERLHVEPQAAQVRVMGAAGAVESLGPESVSVVLHISELEAGVYQLEPEVVAPDGVVSTSVDPSSFQVIVSDGAVGTDGSGAAAEPDGAEEAADTGGEEAGDSQGGGTDHEG
jgi:YbbR domain-containing protein